MISQVWTRAGRSWREFRRNSIRSWPPHSRRAGRFVAMAERICSQAEENILTSLASCTGSHPFCGLGWRILHDSVAQFK